MSTAAQMEAKRAAAGYNAEKNCQKHDRPYQYAFGTSLRYCPDCRNEARWTASKKGPQHGRGGKERL